MTSPIRLSLDQVGGNITDDNLKTLFLNENIQPFWCWDPNIPGKLGQYHGCWYPGSMHHHISSTHDINHMQCGYESGHRGVAVLLPGFAIIWQQYQVTKQPYLCGLNYILLTTHNVSASRNDFKCKYNLFVFFLKNSAQQGLRYWLSVEYHQISNIRCTKSPNLNDSCLVLPLSLPNPLKPGVKSRMKM